MDYRKITSSSNPHIKEAVELRDSGRRHGGNTFLIEGPHLIETALAAGAKIRSVFFADSFIGREEGREFMRRLPKDIHEVFEVTPQILRKIAETETPQGIIATVAFRPRLLGKLSLKEIPLIAVVDGVQDPGNLGTIIRTSDAAGADAVIILPGSCDPFMPKTIRSTAGSVFNIPIVRTDAAALLEWLTEKTIRIGVTASDGRHSIFDAALDLPIAFVFGNEAHGVSARLRESSDITMSIPIYGKAESLNVATSAAICLYEAVRQRIKRLP